MTITTSITTLPNGTTHRIYTAHYKNFTATASSRTRAIINALNFIN